MKVIIRECECRCGCTGTFQFETGKRGRPPTRCEPCRVGCGSSRPTAHVVNTEDKPNNTCETCGNTFPRGKGRQAKNCPTCRAKLKLENANAAPKEYVFVCRDCEKETRIPLARGRKPVRCIPCREAYQLELLGEKNATAAAEQKPDNVCRKCDETFPHVRRRGKQPSLCPTCHEAQKVQPPKRSRAATAPEIRPVVGEALWLAVEDMLRARGQLLSQQ